MMAGLLRLSRFVVFVEYEDFVEVQHAARGERHRVDRAESERLRRFVGFRPSEAGLQTWVDVGVLVEPFRDTLAHHSPAPNSEAALATDYQRWYWRHEVESERDYRWLGEVVVKMPSDLFYLQELIAGSSGRRVLELGRGRGGGVWYLASILHLLGGGVLVSLDFDPRPQEIKALRWTSVEQHVLVGDALGRGAPERVLEVAQAFDLVVIDLGGPPQRNLAALRAWVEVVAHGGTVFVEDLWGHDDERVLRELDEFMLKHREFGLCERGARHPLLKGVGLLRGC